VGKALTTDVSTAAAPLPLHPSLVSVTGFKGQLLILQSHTITQTKAAARQQLYEMKVLFLTTESFRKVSPLLMKIFLRVT